MRTLSSTLTSTISSLSPICFKVCKASFSSLNRFLSILEEFGVVSCSVDEEVVSEVVRPKSMVSSVPSARLQ